MIATLLLSPFAFLPLLPPTLAHGHQVPISSPTDDWATRHMAEEHHISNMDPSAFFTLHDYSNTNIWTPADIRRTYGLDDESTKEVAEERKAEIVRTVVELFDGDGDGVVGREEWLGGWREGKRLGDFGTGPGHHGDDEYEYEIHHFEKFHDENTKEEDLTHPEDIAHFKKHDEMDAAADYLEALDAMPIVEQNIPQKFRRY
ncbi:hypothetical protein MMC21_003686 [Puttea exsequens]|nr:hypothetical protein [Puttea exsequens]